MNVNNTAFLCIPLRYCRNWPAKWPIKWHSSVTMASSLTSAECRNKLLARLYVFASTFTIPQTRHRKADILLVVNDTFRGPTWAKDFQDLRVFQVGGTPIFPWPRRNIWGASIWRQGAIVENIIPEKNTENPSKLPMVYKKCHKKAQMFEPRTFSGFAWVRHYHCLLGDTGTAHILRPFGISAVWILYSHGDHC